MNMPPHAERGAATKSRLLCRNLSRLMKSMRTALGAPARCTARCGVSPTSTMPCRATIKSRTFWQRWAGFILIFLPTAGRSFLIPAESENCDTVEIYEAPIDAMSGATLRQYKHDSPWRSVHYLALGGLNHQPIDYFLQQHPEVKRVSLCFDRDDPGRNFTKIVAKQLAERGYIVQDAPPAIGKDYNDYLLAARRLISMER